MRFWARIAAALTLSLLATACGDTGGDAGGIDPNDGGGSGDAAP